VRDFFCEQLRIYHTKRTSETLTWGLEPRVGV
jgi:hypothetical protein